MKKKNTHIIRKDKPISCLKAKNKLDNMFNQSKTRESYLYMRMIYIIRAG